MKPGLNKLFFALSLSSMAGLAAAQSIGTPLPISYDDIRQGVQVQAASLRSVLEPRALAGNPSYRFAIRPKPAPTAWVLLLGALFTGGFIARRRLPGV